jgi:hypothetical protein
MYLQLEMIETAKALEDINHDLYLRAKMDYAPLRTLYDSPNVKLKAFNGNSTVEEIKPLLDTINR